MKFTMALMLSLAVLLLAAQPAQSISPITKVITMLKGMKEQGEKEKQNEKVQFAAYKQWCDSETATKTREVAEAGDAIELLKADIETAESAAGVLAEKVSALDADISEMMAEQQNATAAREGEEATYKDTHKDYTESIQAIMKATHVLKEKASGSVEQKEALSLLGGMSKMPEAETKKVTAFLAMYHSDDVVQEQPEAEAYEFSSSGISDMLEKLRDKFSDERAELEKEELNQFHAYSKLAQGLKFAIKNSEEAKSNKVQEKAQEQQTAASKKAQLAEAEASLKSNDEYLAEVKQTCEQKASDYEERTKVRAEELAAIDKATELLSAEQVSSTQSRVSLLQQVGTALASLRSTVLMSPEARVVEYLQNQAKKYDSRVLSSLALRVSSGGDPMAKVKTMVENLITRLQEESSQEMQHKEWCDTEMADNEKGRTAHSADVDRITEDIDLAQADAAKLGSDITELTGELAENSKSLADQTEARAAEKAENNRTIEDAKAAQDAVTQAIAVLQDFYAGARKSSALVQEANKGSKAAPEIFEGAYQGQSGDSGIVAMLEVVQSDYSRLESTTSAQENAAHKEFEKMKDEMAVLKAQQEKDVQYKTQQKGEKEQSAVTLEADLATAQKELDAAAEYYEQLKDSCLATGSTAQERNARRTEEIESLKEAANLLESVGASPAPAAA